MKLAWYETSSAFYIVDEYTGRAQCIGDGVDMFFDIDGEPIEVASDEFYRAMNSLVNDPETYEAYFGDTDEV